MANDRAGLTDKKPGPLDDASTQLASQRTAMSFERTAMSSDSTLMSVIRTSLSLIGFGFTIFQFFHTLNDRFLEGQIPPTAPRRFGGALILLGILLLALGIFGHMRETHSRRLRRKRLCEEGLIRGLEPAKPSSAMTIAVLLLLVGLIAFGDLATRAGPL